MTPQERAREQSRLERAARLRREREADARKAALAARRKNRG